MSPKNKHTSGFTIVELLIVIVVIGILAAITIVAYNGIQDRARISAATSRLTQVARKISVWQVDNPGATPTTLAEVGVSNDDASLQLTSDNSVTPATYCVTVTSGALRYYINSTNSTPVAGACTGYNQLAWNKSNPSAPVPIPSATVDTSVFRVSTASMRIGPNSTGRPLYGNPYSGTPGQVYSVSMWIRTDSNWDGLANNSKIRFGDATSGALLTACGYNGVKTSWTQVFCNWTMTAGSPSVTITVGNDGTVGNIWIDDLSVSRTN
jgi:prepilin-type N-terminal cleavage/methylation domain-containing protein